MDRTLRNVLIGVGVLAALALVAVVFLVRSLMASGITAGPDKMFGDQHLKTAVALIELHKVRNGEYPDSLRSLEFVGQWDQIALQSVSYHPDENLTGYYLEVRRGWIGKPEMQMPAEFWMGTGYRPELKPESHE